MTIVNRVCKFCGKPLNLQIDDDYDRTHDRFKIVGHACCDRCAKLRETRRILTETIAKVISAMGADRSRGNLDDCRNGLIKLTKRYVRMVSEWTDTQVQWEEEIVNAIMDRPARCGEILKRLWPVKEPQLL